MFVVATFYKFVSLPDAAALGEPLRDWCDRHGIRGTILLAPEGINGTIAGSQAGIDAVLGYLRGDARFADLTAREAIAPTMPFQRLKVRQKREIVTFGVPAANPAAQVGTYVAPADWNQLLTDPSVTVIDTRNDYEVAIGSFRGAQNPHTASFRDFPAYVQQHLDPAAQTKVALFCTGGIRCEKATSYLLAQGFQQVYHLQGGILNYLETVPAPASLWEGECFVFDERVAVGHGLAPGSYELCLACGHPIAAADKVAPGYEPGISCPHCVAQLTPAKRDRQEARRQQFL